MGDSLLEALLDRHAVRHVRVGPEDWSYFDSAAAGPAVLLLGGGQGDASVFHRQFEAFGAQARLVAPTYAASADLAATLADLLAFMDAVGLARPHVVGSSLGGYLGLALAQAHPDRLDRLIAACAFADCAAEKALFPPASRIADQPAEVLKAQTLAKLEAAGPPASAAHLTAAVDLRTAITRQPAQVLKGRTLAILAAPPLAALRIDPQAVALLDCEDDPVITPATRTELRARLPGSVRITLALGGHFPAMLAPDQFNALMQRHLGL